MKKSVSVWMLLVALLLSLCLSGCSNTAEEAVSVESVEMITGIGSTGVIDRFAGVIVSEDLIEVQKDMEKPVLETVVSVGDDVLEGQRLFSYDTEDIKLTLEKEKLELEQLQNSVTTKNAQLSALEKEKAGAGAGQQLEYTVEIQSLQIDIKETEYSIKTKEAEIQRTELTLENADVLSPVAGRVQSINSEGTNEYGEPLPYIVIQQAGAYRVKGTINELNRDSIYEGMPVRIDSRVDSQSWTGTITMIDWENQVKSENPYYYEPTDEMTESSKYPFYVTLDSAEGLMLGQHVYIATGAAETSDDDTLWLPSYYISDLEDDPYVWAANKRDKLEQRELELGAYNAETDCYEVCSGLTAEDYIAFPSELCSEGVPVVRYDAASFGDAVEEPVMEEGLMPEAWMEEEGVPVEEEMMLEAPGAEAVEE